jgi:hypothetical protein
MRNSDNKFKQVVKKAPVRGDAIFWENQIARRPTLNRQIKKLMRYTEYVRSEGSGYILRVTKEMQVFKRGVYYIARLNTSVARKDAMVRVSIKTGTEIFFYPSQGNGKSNALKLRSNAATIVSIHDLNDPEKKLGFAVSYYSKDLTGEQMAYVPGKSVRLRMNSFKNECGSGFHFYLFLGEVNRLYKN